MNNSDPVRPPVPTVTPTSAGHIFITFTVLALQGFGGVLAVTQRELVQRKRWLTADEFLELLAVAQVLPGPNVINLAIMVGDRFRGVRGALAALGGMLTVPLFIVLALTAAYAEFASIAMVSGALRGMGAVAAGLIVGTAVKLWPTLRSNAMGPRLCAGFALLAFGAVAGMRWPLVWVVVGLGSLAVAVAWVKVRP